MCPILGKDLPTIFIVIETGHLGFYFTSEHDMSILLLEYSVVFIESKERRYASNLTFSI